MIATSERQQILDEEHLRLLRITYLLFGGTYAASAVFPLFYVLMGVILLAAPSATATPGADPRFTGLFFILLGGAMSAFFGALGSLQLYVARCLRLRQARTLCLVVAVVSCIFVPIGTALGIFTLIALNRPTVQTMFSESSSLPPAAPPALSASSTDAGPTS